jgi:mannose-6-phosphate isomerase-like protein (cupin superfamily)
MSTPYTIMKITEVADSAPGFGMEDVQEARFAKDALDAELTGVSHHRIKPNRRQPFGHRHDRAEEVYVVLSGSGQVKLDDEVRDVGPLDAIRVAPSVTRAFQSGPDGLELIAVGPRCDGDGELLRGWWAD